MITQVNDKVCFPVRIPPPLTPAPVNTMELAKNFADTLLSEVSFVFAHDAITVYANQKDFEAERFQPLSKNSPRELSKWPRWAFLPIS
jgi:hypothetical protein